MRNDGNGYVPTSMGINLHYLWCKYLVGEPIVHPCNLNTPCYFMADTRDWVHVMKGRVSMKRAVAVNQQRQPAVKNVRSVALNVAFQQTGKFRVIAIPRHVEHVLLRETNRKV